MPRCPGQDLGLKKPEEVISYAPCPKCSYELEFWFDDLQRTCPKCKHVAKKDLAQILKDYKCAIWCKEAELCIGTENYNKVKAFKEAMNAEGVLESLVESKGDKFDIAK